MIQGATLCAGRIGTFFLDHTAERAMTHDWPFGYLQHHPKIEDDQKQDQMWFNCNK